MTFDRLSTFLNSLRGRLLISHVVIALASLSIAGIAVISGILPIYNALTYTRMEDSLILAYTATQDLPRFYGQRPGASGGSGFPTDPGPGSDEANQTTPQQLLSQRFNAVFQRQLESQNLRMLLVDLSNNNITFDSGGAWEAQTWSFGVQPETPRTVGVSPPVIRTPRADIVRSRARVEGRTWLYVATRLDRTSQSNSSAIVLLSPATTLASAGRYLRAVLPGPLFAVILSALLTTIWLLGAWFTRSLTRNLQPVIVGTQEIAAGNLDYRVSDSASSLAEVKSLGRSFNLMAQEVQASRQAQRDFVANVGHDLKTPLTSIQGFTQALLDGTADSPQARRRAADIIYDESQRLGRLVDELLDVARLDRDRLQLRRHDVGVDDFLAQIVDRFGPKCQRAGIVLRREPVARSLVLDADPDRLQRIFSNLLDNAVTHTPQGGTITLTAQRVAPSEEPTSLPVPGQAGDRTGSGPDMVELAVIDTGRGIPKTDLAHVFERFYRVDKSRSVRPSSGLGLAIVQELVQAHGGSVGVESQPDQGSRFWMRLPLASSQPSTGG